MNFMQSFSRIGIYKLITLLLCLFSFSVQAQTDVQKQRWYQLDYVQDTFYGISLKKAYDFLKNRKPVDVVVGVIDSGIDTTQVDLKDVRWVNTGEIPNNGKDDDKNGYVDDVYGWNFLGNKNGQNINKENDEETRLYFLYKDRFDGKNIHRENLSYEDKFLYDAWLVANKKFGEFDLKQNKELYQQLLLSYKGLSKVDSILKNRLKTDTYTFEDLRNSSITDMEGFKAKMLFLNMTEQMKIDETLSNKDLMNDFKRELSKLKREINMRENVKFTDYRKNIIGDNYQDFNDRYYGNNDLMGEDALHGTHVSGIIAAQNDNNVGIDGICKTAKIMTLRAVPDGDEYDKDVALSIIYAVDNGAKVINMSFGKRVSPEKYWVDRAFEYAAKKDVLLVHAAGNDNKNIDSLPNYPSAELVAFGGKIAENLITVGASSDPRIDNGKMVAEFSNYGKRNVDVFAPGVKIYATLPGKTTFGYLSGTSMASPVVAGIAAMIRAYFPNLSAVEVKDIIEKSVYIPNDAVRINQPGALTQTTLKALCKTGGIVNAYKAVQLAASISDAKETPMKKNRKKGKK